MKQRQGLTVLKFEGTSRYRLLDACYLTKRKSKSIDAIIYTHKI